MLKLDNIHFKKDVFHIYIEPKSEYHCQEVFIMLTTLKAD